MTGEARGICNTMLVRGQSRPENRAMGLTLYDLMATHRSEYA